MSLLLRVPALGESVREATLGAWKRAEGDEVTADEPLVEVESEKATLEVPSPGAGVLRKILRKAGETVAVGEVIAEIDQVAASAQVAAPAPVAAPGPVAAPVAAAGQVAAKSPATVDPQTATRPPADAPARASNGRQAGARADSNGRGAEPPSGEEVLRAAPSARRTLADSGLTADEVKGSGRGGRISKQDVLRTLEERERVIAPAPTPPETQVALRPVTDGARERVVPMSPLRKTVARRLVEAQRTAAILTTFNEVDMTNVLALRERYQERFTKQHGIKLGFMSFFVKAAIEALRVFPAVNAEVRGADIVYKDHYDIGVAVGGGKGLVVPVVRDADHLSFGEIEVAIAALAARARENKLTIKELEGGTFTISNGGVYGSLLSTPILNPPQSGILGLHAIQKRPIAIADAVVIRPMMYVALSYDHRLVDGREAVQFLIRVKECVEDPERVLLEV